MPHRRHDDLHEEGDVRDGERRWCEVFARVWEVLVHQPLSSRFRLPLQDGGALNLEHAALQVSVRTELERSFFTRAARMLGYVKDDEDSTHAIFIRTRPSSSKRPPSTHGLAPRHAGPPTGARRTPRWWNYVDVIAPPRAAPHFRWQLHLDHRDARPRIEGDGPADREFSGLGDLFG